MVYGLLCTIRILELGRLFLFDGLGVYDGSVVKLGMKWGSGVEAKLAGSIPVHHPLVFSVPCVLLHTSVYFFLLFCGCQTPLPLRD